MKQALKISGAVLLFLIVLGLIPKLVSVATPENSTSISNITKEEYLQQITNNGGGEIEQCVYSRLIDKYGVRETMKIDMKAYKDKSSHDPRLIEEAEACL